MKKLGIKEEILKLFPGLVFIRNIFQSNAFVFDYSPKVESKDEIEISAIIESGRYDVIAKIIEHYKIKKARFIYAKTPVVKIDTEFIPELEGGKKISEKRITYEDAAKVRLFHGNISIDILLKDVYANGMWVEFDLVEHSHKFWMEYGNVILSEYIEYGKGIPRGKLPNYKKYFENRYGLSHHFVIREDLSK